MGYRAEIVLDSVAPNGRRLTTMEVEYPRFIHSEMLTHRAFSRNSASSRAIPFEKLLGRVITDPVIPLRWGLEQRGMSQGDELVGEDKIGCERAWLAARDNAAMRAREMHARGLHKSICNRVIEPWMHITVIITATDWKNFFRQRCHPDAEPHMQKIAGLMCDAWRNSIPMERSFHLPYVMKHGESVVRENELHNELYANTGEVLGLCPGLPSDGSEGGSIVTGAMCRISSARCARVSYLTHEGECDWRKDLGLFTKLVNGSGFGHWSPMEHPAMAIDGFGASTRSGNFRGWHQYRKDFENENGDS